jgi:hypothetical protein
MRPIVVFFISDSLALFRYRNPAGSKSGKVPTKPNGEPNPKSLARGQEDSTPFPQYNDAVVLRRKNAVGS